MLIVRRMLADAFLLNVIYFLQKGARLDLRILDKRPKKISCPDLILKLENRLYI